jgi:hypothetical protein
MRKWLILLFALPATASSAPAWTWVDADGLVHYSDQPVPGARRIELANAQGFGLAVPQPRGPREDAPGRATPYESIEIVSPSDQETLWNIGTTLNVVVQFRPALQPGHRFDVVLDGQRRNLNTSSPRTTVANVFRGAHTMEIVVIDAAGAEIMRSGARSFFVQQTSVQSPTNPQRSNAPPNAPG